MTAEILTGQQIPKCRLIVMRKGIEMEIGGFARFEGRSCWAIVKEQFGWTGNRKTIINKLTELINPMLSEYELKLASYKSGYDVLQNHAVYQLMNESIESN